MHTFSDLDNEYDAIFQAEKKLTEAHLKLDLKAIDDLLHPDYIIVQPGGIVETKAEVMVSLGSDNRHWDTAQTDQLDVRFYRDSAIVVGRWRAKGQNGNEPFDYASRFLSIWVKEDGKWQNVAFQSTEINP